MVTTLLIAAGIALAEGPDDLVRVEDPNVPGAVARSATGAVLLEPPPPGTRWSYESVPVLDAGEAVEAIAALNADIWNTRGHRGQGVKVAVFDLQWFGAEVDPSELGEVTTHDCWFTETCEAPMNTLAPRFRWEEGVHGYACAEVIRDIAPDVELYLVRVNGRTTLENAVDWAIREDIDLVSMSMSFFNSSFYDGTGPISEKMADLAANDVLMVTSAGNYARGHWSGPFLDADGDSRLDFDGANGTWVYLSGGEVRSISVLWNQFRTCGATDLDARVYHANGGLAARASATQDPDADRCEPYERLRVQVEESAWYWLEVTHERGTLANLSVDILANGARIDGGNASGSLPDPGASEHVLTVAAVDARGYLENGAEPFSSVGPTHGGLRKPDLAGPDGLTTAAYGAESFYGTSASAPAVVGALALVMSEEPGRTSSEAVELLEAWAWSDDPTRWDPALGTGRVRLPAPAEEHSVCGRRPLLLPIFLLPVSWFRRSRRRAGPGDG